jgi:hypothetical protein
MSLVLVLVLVLDGMVLLMRPHCVCYAFAIASLRHGGQPQTLNRADLPVFHALPQAEDG